MRRLLAGMAALACLLVSVRASGAACFEFTFTDSPEKWTMLSASTPPKTQTWCYHRSNENGLDTTFLYAVGTEPRAELAALVKRDQNGGIQSLAHGSRTHGQVTLHAISSFLVNPFPVPLDATGASMLGMAVTPALSADFQNKAAGIRAALENTVAPETIYKVEAGTFTEDIDDDLLPYAAYWWPYDDLELSSGPYSPLGKYDNYMLATTGVDPKSREWETENHSDVAVAWGGHCNGWAASSILHEEIAAPLWDHHNDVVIFNDDVNGIFAEGSFCVDWAFYGARNYGNGDLEDIAPVKFHKVLIYYIKHLNKAVAMDYYRDDSVDNNVIGGYTMEIAAISGTNQYEVTASLHGRNYDYYRDDYLGVADTRGFSYSYILEVDANNEITGGHWTGGDNPDFMWVPLAQSNCGRENPQIEPSAVEQMVEDLAPAEYQTDATGWSVSATGLAAGATLPVMGEMHGSYFTLQFGEITVPEGASLTLVARGYYTNPSYWSEGEQSYEFSLTHDYSNSTVTLPFDRLSAVELRNDGTEPLADGSVNITSLQYWGAPQ